MKKCIIGLITGKCRDDDPSTCLPQCKPKVVVSVSKCSRSIDRVGTVIDLININRCRLVTRLEPERKDSARLTVSITIEDGTVGIPNGCLNIVCSESELQFVTTISEAAITRIGYQRVIICVPCTANPDEIVTRLGIKTNECIVSKIFVVLCYELYRTIAILAIEFQSCIEKTRIAQSLCSRFDFHPSRF